jgi:hypothetical protein
MVGPDGKIFPVPANYASKSKLVEGDRLKLTIGSDGSFLFKQVGPAERHKVIGQLKFENNIYFVDTDGKNYHVLYASVTYHKAKPGDKVAIILPAKISEPKWCALEGVIHDIPVVNSEPADTTDLEESVQELEQAPIFTTASDSLPVNPEIQLNVTAEPQMLSPNAEPVPVSITTADDLASATDGAADEVRTNLKIDELEIVGVKENAAPEAVNPQDFEPAQNVAPAPTPNTTTVDSRADSIQELEI